MNVDIDLNQALRNHIICKAIPQHASAALCIQCRTYRTTVRIHVASIVHSESFSRRMECRRIRDVPPTRLLTLHILYTGFLLDRAILSVLQHSADFLRLR